MKSESTQVDFGVVWGLEVERNVVLGGPGAEVFDDVAHVHVHAEGAWRRRGSTWPPGCDAWLSALTQAGLVQERHVLAQLQVPRAGLAALAFLIPEPHEGALVVVEQDAHHTHRQTDADAGEQEGR